MNVSEQIINSLKAAGLSDSEAKVYADLQSHGESQTGRICERTQIRSSHIYEILGELSKKGLVTYKIINNVKVFHAASPDNLKYLFEEREKVIKEEREKVMSIISQLKIFPKTERENDFKYFSGIRGIKSLFTEVMNSWGEGDNYYVVAVSAKAFEQLEAFFLEFHKKRVKDRVSLKIIIDENAKEFGKAREKMPKTEVKYLKIGANTEYGVLNDYFFLTCYDKEPYGLLIKDKNFANTYKSFFEILWNSSKS